MKDSYPDYHQDNVRLFIEEIRQQIINFFSHQETPSVLDLSTKNLEELVKKADHHEKVNRGEYQKLLQSLILERTKCFLVFEEYLRKR